MNSIKKILPLVLFIQLLVSSLDINAQEYTNQSFKEGEVLSYNGYYNCGMIWVKAGKVEMSTHKASILDSDCYNIKAVFQSFPGWDWLFRLRDTAEVYCDTLKLLPYSFNRIVHEGSRHADIKFQFDYNKKQVFSQVKELEKPLAVKKDSLCPCTHDMLSFAWALRNLDYPNFKLNKKIFYRLMLGNDVHELFVCYKGVDTVETRDGTEVECYKFSPSTIKSSLLDKDNKMTIWISKDRNRIPVMVKAKAFIGSVKGVLSTYKGVRYKTTIFPENSGCLESR